MWSIQCLKQLKSLLSTCKHKTTVTKIHAVMIITGILSQGSLIAAYARVNEASFARYVFDQMPQRSIDAWNAMIVACSRAGEPNEVLGLFQKMEIEGVRPDSSIFTLTIKACIGLMEWEMGEEIWRKAIYFGYENDVFIGSSVLNLYAKCGKMDEAMVVFEKMPRRDLVCWTTVVTGLAQTGRPREAIDVCRRMQAEGFEGDKVVMVGLNKACADIGDLKLGLSVHGYMLRRDLLMSPEVQNNLVNMYAKNGHLELATRVFYQIHHKQAASWNTLISGLAQNGFAVNALELLMDMQTHGFKPNSVSLVSALLACAHVGFLKLGKSIHGYIAKNMFDFDQVLCTATIDMYSKCGALSSAQAIFELLDSRDLISWNAMIASYGIHGHGREALSLFLQMIETEVRPDSTTFASLLSALGHAGLVEEGRYWFNAMACQCQINPSEKHYVCMVDLFARAGLVEEALELINSMDIEPGIAVWVALLSGCHNHGNLSIGEKVAKKVLESNHEDSGIQSLVTNFFAMGKKWDEVAGVRKIMRNTWMKKVPAYSAVEVNGDLHTFHKQDGSHRQFEDIVSMLNKVDNEMRTEGYNPCIEFLMQDLDVVEHKDTG